MKKTILIFFSAISMNSYTAIELLDRVAVIVNDGVVLESDIQQKIKHVRIMNKDYLILVGQDGVPFIYDRRGNIRIKLPKNLIIDQNDFYVNSNALVSIWQKVLS